MEFRPCIDIHNGKVKQIVGGSLRDEAGAKENFVSEYDASFYAKFYQKKEIRGGHVILLNKEGTPEYEATRQEALKALASYPGGLMAGGGMKPSNAGRFLDAGASHVIVTSYVFQNGKIHYERLKEFVQAVGKKHLVLDLSCRKKNDRYYIVTDRWQVFTDTVLDADLLERLEEYADEYLIHAVDVEGKASGIDEQLAALLGSYDGIAVTYAGGIHSYDDLNLLKKLGNNRVHATIGSALDLFGGSMDFEKTLAMCRASAEQK